MKHVIVLVALLSATAHADDKADVLFKKGKKLLAEKRYLEACNTFEKVDKIDPGIGAKLNVAKCYEEWGKLAKAYDWFKDAEKMALDTNDKRAEKIKSLVDELDGDVPRLTIKVSDGADTATAGVKLDGKLFDNFNKELRVDPGPHVIEYVAAGKPKTKNVALEKGSGREVQLDIPKGEPKVVVKEPPPPPPPDKKPPVVTPPPGDPGRTHKLVAYGLGTTGAVLFGVAGYLTLDARSSYKTALADECMGSTDRCSQAGLRTTHDAHKAANRASVITLVGAAAIGAGVYFYITAPKANRERAVYVTPAIAPDAVGVVLGGRL